MRCAKTQELHRTRPAGDRLLADCINRSPEEAISVRSDEPEYSGNSLLRKRIGIASIFYKLPFSWRRITENHSLCFTQITKSCSLNRIALGDAARRSSSRFETPHLVSNIQFLPVSSFLRVVAKKRHPAYVQEESDDSEHPCNNGECLQALREKTNHSLRVTEARPIQRRE